jgi:hypothetical protein
MVENIWFKSSLFDVEPGEDEETNPRMYGRQLSNWLRNKFIELGYEVDEVIPEDWGWCVMCQWKPYQLFIGCRNHIDYENEEMEGPIPNKEDILWSCTVHSEKPFFKRLFKKIDTTDGVSKLNNELLNILNSEPEITIVNEPE